MTIVLFENTMRGIMFFKKKGVSPVIAVVLLIAITVAAAALVWTIVGGYLQPVPLLIIETTDTDIVNGTGVWVGVIDSDTAGQLSFVLFGSNGSIPGSADSVDHPGNGDASFRVSFDGVAPGQYTLSVSLNSDGRNYSYTADIGFS